MLNTYSLSNHCNAVLSLVVEYVTVSLMTFSVSSFPLLADVAAFGRVMRNADPMTSCAEPRENCANADTSAGWRQVPLNEYESVDYQGFQSVTLHTFEKTRNAQEALGGTHFHCFTLYFHTVDRNGCGIKSGGGHDQRQQCPPTGPRRARQPE